MPGADQYGVWNTDSNGNFLSVAVGVVSGTTAALESFETSFQQDLNGDGTIGVLSVERHSDRVIRNDEPTGGWKHLSDSTQWQRGGRAEPKRSAGDSRSIWQLDSDRGGADGDRIRGRLEGSRR